MNLPCPKIPDEIKKDHNFVPDPDLSPNNWICLKCGINCYYYSCDDTYCFWKQGNSIADVILFDKLSCQELIIKNIIE
jgi:hypothetical protein